MKGDQLIPLDNSAIIYPPTVARYNNHTFRLSFDLDIEVKAERLLTALENIIERFPYYAVSLHQGFFWYYFLPNKRELSVYPEESSPCGYIDRKKGSNRYLFKVYYTKSRIAVEYYHVITDGTGGLIFLKTLVSEYLKLSGFKVEKDPQIFDLKEKANKEEKEDSFVRFYKNLKGVFNKESSAYHLKVKDNLTDESQVISATMKIEELKKVSSSYNVTITEYLVSELIDALQRIQEKKVKKIGNRKPIRVSVPVNIRKLFDSKTMRNFTLFVVVGVDVRLGHYSFEEIVQQVSYQLKSQVNAKELSRQVTRNVKGRNHLLIRYAPNVFKRPLMKLFSDTYGDTIFSTTISNLGNVSLPKGMKERVKRADFYLSPNKKNKVSVSSIGVNGYLTLNFTSILSSVTTFEKEVLTAMVKKGINIAIETNRKEEI
jgi:NRPS condensation-like uncharacterized protein